MTRQEHTNNSLLVGLYEAVHGKKIEEPGKKYFEATQTMYHNAKISNPMNNETEETKTFLLEMAQYKKIAEERVKYLVVKQSNFLINEEICLIEIDGLRQTGRRLYKRILDIATSIENDGLKDNYMIISF